MVKSKTLALKTQIHSFSRAIVQEGLYRHLLITNYRQAKVGGDSVGRCQTISRTIPSSGVSTFAPRPSVRLSDWLSMSCASTPVFACFAFPEWNVDAITRR